MGYILRTQSSDPIAPQLPLQMPYLQMQSLTEILGSGLQYCNMENRNQFRHYSIEGKTVVCKGKKLWM